MELKKILIAAVLAAGMAFQTNAADIPRKEYPRPQFERTAWVNLNGEWDYTFDFSNSGMEQEYHKATSFSGKITVPFCPESSLSGVGHKDFINHIWYHREISIPQDWSGKNVLLNFGAVYYNSEIYIDGALAGRHFGGSSSFSIDITKLVTPGKVHHLVVRASSDLRSGMQSAGKQSLQFGSYGCNYTRTTGIWQTVWMEAINPSGLKSVQAVADVDQEQLVVWPTFYSDSNNKLKITLKDGNKVVAAATVKGTNSSVAVLPVKKAKLWSPESPFLYDITYQMIDPAGKVIDEVSSYIGMRKVHTANGKFYLNNEPYFQRLVMNQGYYPDGIWTAPTDEALKNDILLSKKAGFNGARLHQKFFEERFHYWADKLGFITWGESPNWGMNPDDEVASRNLLSEWIEILERDRNHPSIITWAPLTVPLSNVSSGTFARLVFDLQKLTKAIDPSRPFNDLTGSGFHFLTDIWSISTYEPDATRFALSLKPDKNQAAYANQPFIIGEFGGIVWETSRTKEDTWGHGGTFTNEDALFERIEKLINAIQSSGIISGFCYTQFSDIEQEKNGIYTYDRQPKFEMERIRSIFEKIPSRPIKK